MRRKRRSPRGYTLVEVVVALAVASILFASMLAIMAPIYRIYKRTSERSDAQLVAGTVLDSIRATCSNARFVQAGAGVLTVNGGMQFALSGGYLTLDGDTTDAIPADLVLAKGVYNGKTITGFTCTQVEEDRLVEITITVSGEEGASCTLVSTVGSMRGVINTPSPSPAPTP